LSDWHLTTDAVSLMMIPDKSNALRDVEVGLRRHTCMDAGFFKSQSDLHEPVGLTVTEAQARMEAAGFFCDRTAHGTPVRRALYCQRFVENPLGGRIIRVYLYPDESGVIRETEIVDGAGWFDAERCMWPRAEEGVTLAVAKGALFPVRVGCRYTLETAGFLLACCLASGSYIL
jgi:hypothetical protein